MQLIETIEIEIPAREKLNTSVHESNHLKNRKSHKSNLFELVINHSIEITLEKLKDDFKQQKRHSLLVI